VKSSLKTEWRKKYYNFHYTDYSLLKEDEYDLWIAMVELLSEVQRYVNILEK